MGRWRADLGLRSVCGAIQRSSGFSPFLGVRRGFEKSDALGVTEGIW